MNGSEGGRGQRVTTCFIPITVHSTTALNILTAQTANTMTFFFFCLKGLGIGVKLPLNLGDL